MIVSRLEPDGNVALSKDILDALGLAPGDEIGCHIEDGQVTLFRNAPDDEIEPVTGFTNAEIRALLAEVSDDPADSIPAEQAFAELRAYAAAKRAAAE